MPNNNDKIRSRLLRTTTATVMTQLFKRGLRSVWMKGVGPLESPPARFAGPAFTVRFVPAREHEDDMSVYTDPDYPARKAIELVPEGGVLVLDGNRNADGAMLGDILAARLKQRGVAGAVTDAGTRDVEAVLKVGFPIQCAGRAAPASITYHKAVDLEVPIACGGVAVYPGDWVMADGDGVVIIPADLADEVSRDSVEQEETEEWILSEVKTGRSTSGLYPMDDETRGEYEAWRKSSGTT